MDASVKCLLSEYKDLIRGLRWTWWRLVPTTAESKIPPSHWPVSLAKSISLGFSERPCAKNKGKTLDTSFKLSP